MQIKKKEVNKILTLFLFSHLFIWTLIPTISNNNLPLDTIEALAWGSDLSWGFSKHPPLSAFVVEIFYKIFGNQDWAYYLLSHIFVVFTFFVIFKFSKDFLKNKFFSLISLLLLEGIYFYNFTTPEFNVNVCQLPFWSLSVLYCWKGLKNNKTIDWLLFGLFAGLGVLSKYLFVYLLIGMDIFFVYYFLKRKIDFKCFISLLTFFLVLLPHLIWLVENDYSTIAYGLHRTGLEKYSFFNHLIYSLIFLLKQIGILIPFFIMISLIVLKRKINLNFKDKKLLFLLAINIVPLILMFLTSVFMGAKIRTMWMTPFYLFLGVLLVYIFQNKILLKKINQFFSFFLVLFIFSPLAYYYISATQKDKRTDYPGKEIAYEVEKKWKDNFRNEIMLVAGDEWHGGNLSYHLTSRPKWENLLEKKKRVSLDDPKSGIIIIGNDLILSKACNTVFFKINEQGVCMIGVKK